MRIFVTALISFLLGVGVFFVYTMYQHNAQMTFLRGTQADTFDLQTLHYPNNNRIYTTDFLNQKKDEFMAEGKMFITADLTAMHLNLYQGKEIIFEAPITAKGKDGTSWETPAGVYEVLYKNKDHFSSLGRVYMPWSMQFQGNFFIHATPLRLNRTEIFSQYSAGCIRLDTAHAKKLYSLVTIDTPVIVYESLKNSDKIQYAFQAGQLSAQQFLVADIENGYVFTSGKDDEVVSVHDAVQLITAIVATEYLVINKNIYADQKYLVPTMKPRLESGQKFRLYDYLFPLLQESSYEAAYAIMRPIGIEKAMHFVNQKAQSIGMAHAKFVDPSGASDENVASAQDLYQLMHYMYYNRMFLLSLSGGKIIDEGYGAVRFSDIENMNIFLDNPDFVGGKVIFKNNQVTGGVFVFMKKFKDSKRPVAITLLNSKDVKNDVRVINQFIEQNFIVE